MKKYLIAAVLAAAFTHPALATTFPTLTTIYVGSGVRDDGAIINSGIATVFNCSNVSGLPANVRFLVLDSTGAVEANATSVLSHGATFTAATHSTLTFLENADLATDAVGQGVVNIESTQSGVFCNAMIVDAADAGEGISLPLVRINGHPGAEE